MRELNVHILFLKNYINEKELIFVLLIRSRKNIDTISKEYR